MAMQQTRKRSRADEPPQEYRPSKKCRVGGSTQGPSNFTPAFWDNLSKVWLTRRALRELDRRNNAQPIPEPAAPAVNTTCLAQFARHSGPDLRRLRGYPEPKGVAHAIASSQSSRSRHTTQSTKATSVSSRSGKSFAYGPEFQQHLTDYNIYPPLYDFPDHRPTPKPNNANESRLLLSATRSSLSPSRFTESVFEDFQRKNARVVFENDVITTVVPVLCGDADIPTKQNVLFTEFRPITTYDIAVKPQPHLFDGANLQDIHEKVRDKDDDHSLYPLIIPTKHPTVPVAPNFFLEAKGPSGGAHVAQRQACYDGAFGARAIHSLQNYHEEEPVYDGNAYTYSSTYHAGTGTLQLYAHHLPPPTDSEGRPEYHMTKLRGYDLTSDRETCVQGIGAFRNVRDLAQRRRDEFIRSANGRASRSTVLLVDDPDAQQDGSSGSDEFVDCEEHVASEVATNETAATSSQYVDEGATPSQNFFAEDAEYSQESTSLGVVKPAMSFNTSVTSNFSIPSVTRSKRNRGSRSPPTELEVPKKQNRAEGRT